MIYEQVAEAISTSLRSVGLHAVNVQFGHNDGDPDNKFIVGSFLIGDLALSDRVQNPAAEGDKDEFTEISQTLLDDRIEEIRRSVQEANEQEDNDDQ